MQDVTGWERAEKSSGTKTGHWVLEPETRRRGLVKKARYREAGGFLEGEAWAEILSSDLGRELGLPVPEVVPVLFDGEVCPLSWDCCPVAWELYEGVTLSGSREPKSRLSIEEVHRILCNHLDADEAREGLIRLVCFDLMIANTDRHWHNWGVLVPTSTDEERPRMAPFYDNGSAFGSNLSPARIRRYLEDVREQERYDAGFVYEMSVGGDRRPGLREVLRCLKDWDRTLAGIPAMIEELSTWRILELMRRIPPEVADTDRRSFARTVLERRRALILEAAQ